MSGQKQLKTRSFISRDGARIYRIPLRLFSELRGFAHLVVTDGIVALVDVGSGFGHSNEDLEHGFDSIQNEHGEPLEWSDLTHVLITHGHIDHFGGLSYVRERSAAPIGIHELDRRVLTGYEERLATVAGRLNQYLAETGVGAEEQEELMDLYLLGKQLFSSQLVDFTFEAVGMRVGPLKLLHVPGHTPGQVVIQIHDVLLSADHILERISPHLAPERITLTTGLDHYLDSLEKTRALADDTRLVLGGHEGPFEDLAGRIEDIRSLYRNRLAQVLALTDPPRTIAELADGVFGETHGYHRRLALEEAGAYVEYLLARGNLSVDDLASLEHGNSRPIRYRKVDELGFQFERSTSSEAARGALDVRI